MSRSAAATVAYDDERPIRDQEVTRPLFRPWPELDDPIWRLGRERSELVLRYLFDDDEGTL